MNVMKEELRLFGSASGRWACVIASPLDLCPAHRDKAAMSGAQVLISG